MLYRCIGSLKRVCYANLFWCTYAQVATSGFVTEEKAVEVEALFKSNPSPSTERVVKQNCEAIRLNAKWLERDASDIQEWLKNQ